MPVKKIKDIDMEEYEKWARKRLLYEEKHMSWKIFKGLYLAIYLFIISILLIYYHTIGLTFTLFAGIVLALIAIMVVIFSFVEVLHYRMLLRNSK